MRAIEAAGDALYAGSVPETTPEQRRADALGLLAERALTTGFAAREPDDGAETSAETEASSDDRGSRAERYLVVLHCDQATIAGDEEPGRKPEHDSGRSDLEDGTRVSAETSRRIACDASVVRVRPGGGRNTRGPSAEIEGKTRAVPVRLRRALEIRDRGCRFPGCGSRFTHAHHIRHWADGGPTRLDNLVLLCGTHHRLLHEGGFKLEPNPERPGRPTFYAPKGVRIPDVPPRMSVNGRSLEAAGSHRPPRWEQEVPLALYLRAWAAIG